MSFVYHHWVRVTHSPPSSLAAPRIELLHERLPNGNAARQFISVSRGILSVFGVEPESITSPNGTENMLKLLNTTEYGPSFFQQLETSARAVLLHRDQTPTPTPIKLQTDAAEGVIGARAWVVGEVVVSGLARQKVRMGSKQKNQSGVNDGDGLDSLDDECHDHQDHHDGSFEELVRVAWDGYLHVDHFTTQLALQISKLEASVLAQHAIVSEEQQQRLQTHFTKLDAFAMRFEPESQPSMLVFKVEMSRICREMLEVGEMDLRTHACPQERWLQQITNLLIKRYNIIFIHSLTIRWI